MIFHFFSFLVFLCILMEEILSYNQYGTVLWLCFDDDENLVIFRSSNRLIKADGVIRVDKNAIFVKDVLLEFFELHSISENQQTEDEKLELSSIINFMKELKHDLIQENISIFDNSKIIFCLPAEWTEDKYEHDLRVLFLKAEWINKEDHKNRLTFSTFIERFVHYPQIYNDNEMKFERERKYLLFHMDQNSVRLTCYQMQCAKELIAVSKKLAASDFLLTPTVLDNESIYLSSFDEIVQNIIERMFITRQNANNTTLNESELHSLINQIIGKLDHIYSYVDTEFDTPLTDILGYTGDEMEQKYMQILEGWNCGTFIKNISNDTDIRQLLQKVVDTFKRILGKYSQVKNSPDDVQDIILCAGFYYPIQFYKDLFLDVLLNAKIIDVTSKFIHNFIELSLIEAAMQKPYKMIQIANALSPPLILNKDNLPLHPNLIKHARQENDLLQPNSFYVQAYVYGNHINFILNKVVAVSSIDNTVQKSTFTIQERSINIETITNTTCDIMWNHFQALDFEDDGNRFFRNCCDEHGVGEFNAENYFNFKTNLKLLMSNWLQDKNMLSFEEFDIYQPISTNINCECTLNITYRMLLEVGVKSAITNIATAITSTLASNDLFGLYDVSALIIINDSKNVALNRFYSILKEATLKRLQVYQKRPAVFHGKKELVTCKLLGNWVNDVKQILGIGSYSQVSSMSYTAKIGRLLQEVNDWFDCSSKFYEVSQIKQDCNFYILKKNDCLHQEDVIKRFIIEHYYEYDDPSLEIFMLSFSQAGEYCSRIMISEYSDICFNYPVTMKISPQHYSSTVKIEFSYVRDGLFPNDYSESVTIHEKLVLKQQ